MFPKIQRILKLKNILIFLLWFFLMIWFEYKFLNSELIIWNMWLRFYYTELSLVYINSFLFWTFLAMSLYKLSYFNPKSSFFWIVWGLFGIAVSWCAACSITIASYIWLAWLITALPYWWIELKFVAFFLLLYSNYSTYKNLENCSLKLKK